MIRRSLGALNSKMCVVLKEFDGLWLLTISALQTCKLLFNLKISYFIKNCLRWHSSFFTYGKCVPVIRGAGVYQPAVDLCIQKLKLGEWVGSQIPFIL